MDIPGTEYIVVCREDQKDDGSPGDYTLATRTVFPNKEAAEVFASGCASSRQALVVGGRFTELRHDFEKRFGAITSQLAMTDCEKHGHTVAIRHDSGLICRACFIGAARLRGVANLSGEDPIVAYQCAHYLYHDIFENKRWIGLYLTKDRQQAIYEACQDSGKNGLPATNSDLICVSVHQSELEAVKAKHTNIRTLVEWGT